MSAALKAVWLAPHQWKPGESGNPAGRPKGARARLEHAFLDDLLADWNANGKAALVAAREKDPVGYVKVTASLMPKMVEPDSGLEDFNRDELRLAIDALRSFVALRSSGEARSETDEPVKA